MLHTSDWHLGRTLCGRRRGAEFAAFLDWLADTVESQQIDVLLVAGDIFDGLSPSPAAQELYYRFLSRMAASSVCGHVVIIAGNHDSAALLSAPAVMLKALDIHVVGRLSADIRDEIISLRDKNGLTRLIVAAVPYPRDRDLRESLAGENPEEKEQKLTEAICAHYQESGQAARELLQTLNEPVPVVGMGHLFAAGGLTVEGDGVRNLYVGSLGRVPAEAFPPVFSYLALGHLHQPQLLGGDPTRRYSGAPLAHSFAEAGRDKSLALVEFSPAGTRVETIAVPVFQRLERLEGDWPAIEAGLERLAAERAEVWLEIEYSGQAVIGNLKEKVAEAIGQAPLEVLRLKNRLIGNLCPAEGDPAKSLDELDEDEVFRRCLAAQEIPEEQKPGLWAAYGEILASLREEEE